MRTDLSTDSFKTQRMGPKWTSPNARGVTQRSVFGRALLEGK